MSSGGSLLLAMQPMNRFVSVSLLGLALVFMLPIVVLFVECVTATLPVLRRSVVQGISRPTIAILMPAHNEALGIAETLMTILPQLSGQDRLFVIADNCDDETAAIARQTGATVLERQDQEHRGKGYALDFGLTYLASDPPAVVVMIDADCRVAQGAIEAIASLAAKEARPVQAVYLLEQSAKPTSKDAVSVLAFTVKNLVRPLGLHRLNLPCLLTGTGMAFPWSAISQISLASGNIVEDMHLGLDLAIAGYPPMFCANAVVTGVLPRQIHAAKKQRTRWEHGHLQTLKTQVPRLIIEGLRQRRFDLWAIALDLSIPPLALLVMLWLITAIAALIFSLIGGWQLPFLLLGLQGCLIFAAVLMSWAKFARKALPIGVLLAVPLYIFWKIPLYLRFLIKPQTKWIRTERDRADSSKP